MKCSACGGENSVCARFCKHCGAQQSGPVDQPKSGSTVCPSCGKPTKAGAKFCTSCSASLTAAAPTPVFQAPDSSVTCPKCGAGNKNGVGFCVACGHDLRKSAEATQAEPAVPQVPIQAKDVAACVYDLSSSTVTTLAEVQAGSADLFVDEVEGPSHSGYEQKQRTTKLLMWGLGAIVVGALAARAFLYLGKSSTQSLSEVRAPSTAPAENPAQTPVPAAAPLMPAQSTSQPVPPEPVAGNPPAAPKSVAATRDGIKKAQPLTKHASREKKPVERVASKPTSTTKPNPQATPSDTSKVQIETSAAKSDKPSFESELDACRKKDFFERSICSERVKWKYCTVNGIWNNNKPGCEIPKTNNF